MEIVKNIPKISPEFLKATPKVQIPVPIEAFRRFMTDSKYLNVKICYI
jgi:hypothetical protein